MHTHSQLIPQLHTHLLTNFNYFFLHLNVINVSYPSLNPLENPRILPLLLKFLLCQYPLHQRLSLVRRKMRQKTGMFVVMRVHVFVGHT